MAAFSIPIALDPPVEIDDDQLLLRFHEGDRAALEELFQKYRQPAFRVAYRLLGNEADALDAVQDGFIKALTHLGTFEHRSSFKTWLLRVVSNASLDLGRQRSRRETVNLDAAEVQNGPLDQLQVLDESGSRLERAELRSLIDEALQILSDSQRQTFVLQADAGLSYREVAEVLDISIGTVMSRLFYAREKMRAFLEERLAEDQ